jgi:hypothetical protein
VRRKEGVQNIQHAHMPCSERSSGRSSGSSSVVGTAVGSGEAIHSLFTHTRHSLYIHMSFTRHSLYIHMSFTLYTNAVHTLCINPFGSINPSPTFSVKCGPLHCAMSQALYPAPQCCTTAACTSH